MRSFDVIHIQPLDLIDAAGTIPLGRYVTCDWLKEWTPAERFLDYARNALQMSSDCSLINALSNAKRAVACRIDMLLQYNHLAPFGRANYPRKLSALNDIGVRIPDVVQQLVVTPRNELEHDYRRPSEYLVRHAVDISELLLSATESERQENSIIAANWSILTEYVSNPERQYVKVRGFEKDSTMLFIDVFATPCRAMVVDAKRGEIRTIRLDAFSESESIRLAKLLRLNRVQDRRDAMGYPLCMCLEIKRQAGL